jgi:preprotein translocase subunit Sec63
VTRALLLLVLALLVMRLVRSLLGAGSGSRGRAPEGLRGWDPHAVLGVDPGASRDEIARAYREQLKRYHPDRVADLGPELQQVAHRKTVELQRAYTELTR